MAGTQMSDQNIMSFLVRLEDKMENLTVSVNEYKTSTALIQGQQAEKIIQVEEKIKQLFIFKNKDTETFQKLSEETKSNRHEIANHTQQINHFNEESNEAKIEMKEALNNLSEKIESVSNKIDVNEKADEADRNQALGKAKNYKTFVTIASTIGTLVTIFAVIWGITR